MVETGLLLPAGGGGGGGGRLGGGALSVLRLQLHLLAFFVMSEHLNLQLLGVYRLFFFKQLHPGSQRRGADLLE